MDFKVRGYQSFCGEFLRTDVKISQKIIDEMSDDDQMQIRKIVSSFESELFWLLKDYAIAVTIKEMENYEETSLEEINPENFDYDPKTFDEGCDKTVNPKSRKTKSI